ncbi:preprotein translocase subunit YajC [Nocardioides sp. B-3]|uniref:preprotein translocase subunit YajC n=1 Tax=Nocardioides sp. B-3 TaxID=2895565 RepID=UPI002152CEB3|nr:preprotein translocase subunit YajC [Nocardioides sp. B-3]UUZ59370.1 preprotein translocase subunit YajC [Nocardioides sp. B-3]
MGELASFLPPVAIALLFWVMVVRPASRRQKAIAKLRADLQPGQRVMLSSGIYGTVRSPADDRAGVEIAPGTEIEVARAAISVVDSPADSTGPTDPVDAPDEG